MGATYWTLYKRVSKRALTIPVFGNKKFLADPSGCVTNCVMLFGAMYEHDTLNCMRLYLEQSDNYLDIGANVWIFSILASTCDSSGLLLETFRPHNWQLPKLRAIETIWRDHEFLPFRYDVESNKIFSLKNPQDGENNTFYLRSADEVSRRLNTFGR